MNWTLAVAIVTVIGLTVVLGAAIASATLPDCGGFSILEAGAADRCFAAKLPQQELYGVISNAGFAVAALGALGLVGRYTGLLRR